MIRTARFNREVTVTLNITPDELAQMFEDLGSDGQAAFFNALGARAYWPMQLAHIAREKGLSDNGRAMMRLIGEYAPTTNERE